VALGLGLAEEHAEQAAPNVDAQAATEQWPADGAQAS
jgi:hypothetical protein